jgi:predicted nucleic acid-binding protein
MRIYFDPSLLIALYLPEARTASLRVWLNQLGSPIGLNVWQELEFRNSARQKVLRGEAAEGDLARTFRVFDDDCIQGRIVRRSLSWEAVFAEGERLSRKFASGRSCRAFDLVHVAVALVSNLRDFATLDEAQAKLAQAAGLNVLELPA